MKKINDIVSVYILWFEVIYGGLLNVNICKIIKRKEKKGRNKKREGEKRLKFLYYEEKFNRDSIFIIFLVSKFI